MGTKNVGEGRKENAGRMTDPFATNQRKSKKRGKSFVDDPSSRFTMTHHIIIAHQMDTHSSSHNSQAFPFSSLTIIVDPVYP